jgi:hypothetical protein
MKLVLLLVPVARLWWDLPIVVRGWHAAKAPGSACSQSHLVRGIDADHRGMTAALVRVSP